MQQRFTALQKQWGSPDSAPPELGNRFLQVLLHHGAADPFSSPILAPRPAHWSQEAGLVKLPLREEAEEGASVPAPQPSWVTEGAVAALVELGLLEADARAALECCQGKQQGASRVQGCFARSGCLGL